MSIEDAKRRIDYAVEMKQDVLDLRGLGLKTLPPLSAELDGLRAIELGSNRLSEFPEDVLKLRGLRRLGLGNNRIATMSAEIRLLQELVSLDLSENRLERLPDQVGTLAKLVEASFYDNRLVEVPAAMFSLKRLERLDLSRNRLAALPSFAECRQSRLRALDASHNKLAEIPSELRRMRALRFLNLADNRLASTEGLDGLDLLDELDLSNNNLTSVVPILTRLRRLRLLDVAGNPIAEEEQDALARFDASREEAHAAVAQRVSGGESAGDDVSYFDQVPFSFNADLAVDGSSAPDLVDLYYKKFSGHNISLTRGDGSLLRLSDVSRTRALDFVRYAQDEAQAVRLQPGEARGNHEMLTTREFMADALARIHGTRLVESDAKVQQVEVNARGRELLPQWSARAAEPESPHRTVGVGFSTLDNPSEALPASEPLACGELLWLWCTIAAAESVAGAIGGGQPLAAGIQEHAELDIAVFPNREGFEVETRTGTLRLAGATCFVLRPADVPESAGAELVENRLFFKVKTPDRSGREQLRLHLYHRGVLVQSLNIVATVGQSNVTPDHAAIEIMTDYVLSNGLDERQLTTLGEHTLSIFANASPDDQAGFRFYGADGELAGSANVDGGKIKSILRMARAAMRHVSWGSDEDYNPSRDNYRYEPTSQAPDLKEDLVRLAKCGYRIWDVLADSYAGDGDVDMLKEMMRRPGVVQLGLKKSSTQLLPLSILYDHPIATELDDLRLFTLCEAFQQGAACLDGGCPNHGNTRIVCPSGFWGFRHAIGVPIGCSEIDAVAQVAPAPLRLLASAYAGKFPLRDAHLDELERLVDEGSFEKKLTYQDTISRMREGGFQLLYFYCHGGVNGENPYVLVGRDDEDPNRIARTTLRSEQIKWMTPRALVFINGCHTTALEPEQAINLVSGFIETAQASGVIGTEVTVFEPLATKIGKAFIERLMAGVDVGTALRDARRALLQGERPNPLGLVYIPFALATLKLAGIPAPTSPVKP